MKYFSLFENATCIKNRLDQVADLGSCGNPYRQVQRHADRKKDSGSLAGHKGNNE